MDTNRKKEISEALVEAMDKENIRTREAARLLNLNPAYISMAKNSNHWDSIGITAWTRMEDWLLTRDRLHNYKFPDEEEVFKPKEKAPNLLREKKDQLTQRAKSGEQKKESVKTNLLLDVEEHSPEVILTKEKEVKKEKPGKSVKIMLFKAEIENLKSQIYELGKELFIFKDESFPVLKHQVEQLYKKDREKKESNTIIIFQRNIYKK